jgi:hypothetical protein
MFGEYKTTTLRETAHVGVGSMIQLTIGNRKCAGTVIESTEDHIVVFLNDGTEITVGPQTPFSVVLDLSTPYNANASFDVGAITRGLSSVGKTLGSLGGKVSSALKSVSNSKVLANIKNAGSKLASGIKAGGSKAWGGLKQAGGKMKEFGKSVWAKAPSMASIKQKIADAAQKVKDKLPTGASVKERFSKITQPLQEKWQQLKQKLQPAKKGVNLQSAKVSDLKTEHMASSERDDTENDLSDEEPDFTVTDRGNGKMAQRRLEESSTGPPQTSTIKLHGGKLHTQPKPIVKGPSVKDTGPVDPTPTTTTDTLVGSLKNLGKPQQQDTTDQPNAIHVPPPLATDEKLNKLKKMVAGDDTTDTPDSNDDTLVRKLKQVTTPVKKYSQLPQLTGKPLQQKLDQQPKSPPGVTQPQVTPIQTPMNPGPQSSHQVSTPQQPTNILPPRIMGVPQRQQIYPPMSVYPSYNSTLVRQQIPLQQYTTVPVTSQLHNGVTYSSVQPTAFTKPSQYTRLQWLQMNEVYIQSQIAAIQQYLLRTQQVGQLPDQRVVKTGMMLQRQLLFNRQQQENELLQQKYMQQQAYLQSPDFVGDEDDTEPVDVLDERVEPEEEVSTQ